MRLLWGEQGRDLQHVHVMCCYHILPRVPGNHAVWRKQPWICVHPFRTQVLLCMMHSRYVEHHTHVRMHAHNVQAMTI
jgi:hypothetical protein